MNNVRINISVIGGHKVNKEIYDFSYEFGKIAAEKGWTIICGGLGGVMEAVAKGVKEKRGTVIGILPDDNRKNGNEYLTFAIATGLGWMRNSLVIMNGDLIVAINGSYGTLSEISYAFIMDKKVFSYKSWDIDGVEKISNLNELINKIESYLSDAKL
jgi:uncharacterized protein (TIGR00725 family)